jgi:putative peptidoglycan binding protein
VRALAAVLLAASTGAAQGAAVPVFAGGRLQGEVADEDAGARGLTLLDLSDDWTPAPFTEAIPYSQVLVALANEMMGAGDLFRHAREDRYYELFGVFPSLGVARVRLADAPRHACHDDIDDAALAAASLPLRAADTAAVTVLQSHLACDGLLPSAGVDGRFGPRTAAALAAFRLRHMIPTGGRLDEETRAALLAGSRELDFRDLLRVLRERVVSATGLIEDGSAAGVWGQVVGRDLDAAALRDRDGWPDLERAAPDLISPATDAAARALGWTSPEGALAFFQREADAGGERVAVALPPPPPYHVAGLALRAEIDRGDVWRRYVHRDRKAARRPCLIVRAETPDGELALVRWPTTIGGWQKEKLASGAVAMRYKPSPTGDFAWRDVVVAPAWFAPPTTPDSELVRRAAGGWELREDVFGPGYRSAYGLVMLMHSRREGKGWEDTGVRTHGSVSYRTIQGGHSHGCHRLFNHLALRLAAFVLSHRPHAAVGEIRDTYERRIFRGGRVLRLRRESRGYGFRLDDPIPVRVLAGTPRD